MNGSTVGYVVLQLLSLLVTAIVLLTMVTVHVGVLGGSVIPLVLLMLAFAVALRYTALYHRFGKARYRAVAVGLAILGFLGSSAVAVRDVVTGVSTAELRAVFREGSVSLWSPIQLPEWWIAVFPLVAGVLALVGTATTWDGSHYPKPGELREIAGSPVYYGVFCAFFGLWSVLFAGISLQRVLVFAPLFEELLKFGVALLVGSALFGRSFTARVGTALVVGSLFGIVEHATTYPSEADSVYLFRTLFHAMTTVLSVGVYTLFEARGERRLRWIAPVYSILIHFFYNTFVVLAAIIGIVVFGGTSTTVSLVYGGAAIILTTGLFALAIASEKLIVAVYEPLDHVLSNAV